MPYIKPMLGDIELQLVQKLDVGGTQSLAEHAVPALEGNLLQGLGRAAARVTLRGVLTGTEAGKGLKDLREKFKSAQPVDYLADLATATKVNKVLIEEMIVRELAGKPERFEYSFTLREYIAPPPLVVEEREEPVVPQPDTPDPIIPPPPDVKVDERQGTLIVEVIVEGYPDYDCSHVAVTVEGKQEDGSQIFRSLNNRTANIWTEDGFPAGDFVVKAVADPPPMTGSSSVRVLPGQTANAIIILHFISNIAKTFIIHFRFDKAFVEPCMRSVLKRAASYARDNPGERLVLMGHTDKSGSVEYNQSLSERRARAVFAFQTFGSDDSSRADALSEWNSLRRNRPVGELPSLKDNWGTREYQHMLQDLGFYPGAVDGDHGKLTNEAVRAYRCHKGLPPGTHVDDELWEALIEGYLDKDKSEIALPRDRFFPNCPAEIFKWTGCGENDPLDRRETAFRPSRRVELIFVRSDKLTCAVPKPVTFDLPAPGSVNSAWCIGPQTPGPGCCLVTPALVPGKNDPQTCTPSEQGPWCRQPDDPSVITINGSIKWESTDGMSDPTPALNQEFVLISSRGRFKADEQAKGEPIAARTSKDGTFSFADMPAGIYCLEVITPKTKPVLVRLADKPGQEVKGNAVCTALSPGQSRLDILILNAPVLRQIRVPAVAHLVRPIDGRNHLVRQCPRSSGAVADQETQHTDVDVQQFFDAANDIWQQARIRFELADLIHEAYSHPISDPMVRGSCEVDDNEFGFLLSRSSYPDCVNVFFFRDLKGSAEAGMGFSVEDGASYGLPGGCAVADEVQTTFGGDPAARPLTSTESTQVLAHELGHYLNLGHADDTPANAGRLMLPETLAGINRILISEEVERARASQAVTDRCVPLKLRVTGATQVGGTLSSRFVIVEDAGKMVTVDAEIPDRLLQPDRGTLVMTGGSPGANDRQRTVSAGNKGEVEVVATYTPVAGSPVVRRAIIDVVTFDLRVEGAVRAGGPDSTIYAAPKDATSDVAIMAEIDPALFFIPMTLISWTNGDNSPDPLKRIVSRPITTPTTVSATMAGVTRSVTILIIEIRISEIDYVGKNQDADVSITISPDPLPAGVSVALELTTKTGTGEADFVGSGSKSMIIVKSSSVTIRGITESSEIDNIRLTASITGQNQPIAQEDFTVFYMQVTEIDFQSGIDIYDANSDVRISADGPEWRLSPPTSYPAAYVRAGGGTGLSRGLRIRAVTTPALSGAFFIKADGPPGSRLAIGEISVNFSNGVASDVSMQFTDLPDTVKRLSNIGLQWRCRLPSWSSFMDINASAHTLYILDAPPFPLLRIYNEYLDFSCSWADGYSGSVDVFKKIWDNIAAQATGWKYYGPLDPQNNKRASFAKDLITRHNGDCDSWADFMVGCCQVHRIDAGKVQLDVHEVGDPIPYCRGIIVGNVNFGTVIREGPPRVSFLYEDRLLGIKGVDPSPNGVAGQGMERPLVKIFNYHAVVKFPYYGNQFTYYDPSYMRTWKNYAEFRNSLAAEYVDYSGARGSCYAIGYEWPIGSRQRIMNGEVYER